jgi:hypothetical protein
VEQVVPLPVDVRRGRVEDDAHPGVGGRRRDEVLTLHHHLVERQRSLVGEHAVHDHVVEGRNLQGRIADVAKVVVHIGKLGSRHVDEQL